MIHLKNLLRDFFIVFFLYNSFYIQLLNNKIFFSDYTHLYDIINMYFFYGGEE